MIVLPDKIAETPAGNPLAPDTPLFDIPVAPVVVCVMLVNAVLIHNVGALEAAPAVLAGVTVNAALVTGDPVAQLKLLVIMHRIASPPTNEAVV